MFSLFAQLICCGKRSRATFPDAPSTVIPNERTPLLDDPREQAPDVSVDHQSLSDRLGTIVRAKEGKMVSVSSRTPFTLHDAEQPTTSTPNEDAGGQDHEVTISRRPPVLTMTPARSHGSFSYLRSDSQSQHSSRSGSRSPSRQRAQSGSASSAPPSSSSGRIGSAAKRFKSPDRSEWFVESESEVEVSVDDESASPTPHSPTSKTPTAPILQIQDVKGIAFDWDS
ncbi:hypothetical protein R3P38DRAFT_1455867 [Favolaschia claudopus]|uniref:Uncharacterized protein n=1 Tax=Favolaschia claudopus TaxID=2862362 RepID=A0AAW0AMH0_9AGAR